MCAADPSRIGKKNKKGEKSAQDLSPSDDHRDLEPRPDEKLQGLSLPQGSRRLSVDPPLYHQRGAPEDKGFNWHVRPPTHCGGSVAKRKVPEQSRTCVQTPALLQDRAWA